MSRLRRLRQKVAQLPLAGVGKIYRLDPVYWGMALHLLREQGFRLPAAVKARLKGKSSRDYRSQCGLAAPPVSMMVPQKLERRFREPAIEFIKTTDLWNDADLPKAVECGSITIFRRGFAMALADVMLRFGYLLIVDPGEGSETVDIGLTTLHHNGTPIWLGCGFTKTQYATHFTTAHENVCHILDAAREEGLLSQAKDTCGFYRHRSWKKSARVVNRETTFAHAIGKLLSAGVAAAQKQGIDIEDMSDPFTKNLNLIHVDDGQDAV